MAWSFATDPEFAEKLKWARDFVINEIEPLDLLFPDLHYTPPTPEIAAVINPLKEQVREQGLWAFHLPEHLGGSGGSAVKLALLNAVLGRSWWASTIFGTQAPDTGNAEILAVYGTEEQKERYLAPLLGGEVFSCYAMTEPQGGADPGVFTTTARRDDDGWVIDGRKFFASNARTSSFFIVMAMTDPTVPVYNGMTMFLVEADALGVSIERHFGLAGDPIGVGSHALLRFDGVRVPDANVLGTVGRAFEVAQVRLGGGRLHHAMRTVGLCERSFEMILERAVSRSTKGTPLSEKQLVQEQVADAWAALHQLRLQVLHAAWVVDEGTEREAREVIAGVKFAAPRALQDVVSRCIQIHGALGISNQLPVWEWLRQVHVLNLADGPVEVHKLNLAKSLLKSAEPSSSEWPTELIADRLESARARYPQVSQ